MKMNFKKTNQTDFRVKRVIKEKDEKLYVKRKGCNSFQNCMDRKYKSRLLSRTRQSW